MNEANQHQSAGFCQDCGRSLTNETRRIVGQAVFCEACLARRIGFEQSAGNTTGYTAQAPPYAGAGSVPPNAPPPNAGAAAHPVWYQKLPSPVLATLLGLIPGVGAMYNGQFAKGIAHIVIFAVLNSLAHVNDVFGILVAGWICYQSFEAYHTANAIRHGTPLPDPFGLNNIGERLGFKGAWTHPSWERPAPVPPIPAPIVTPPPTPADEMTSGAGEPVVSTVSVAPEYVDAPVPTTPTYTAAQTSAYVPYTAASYGQPNPLNSTDQPSPAFQPVAAAWEYPVGTVPPAVSPRRFPTSALWLIGFGLLFLILTVSHDRINVVDFSPWLLGGLSVFLFVRSMIAGNDTRFGSLTISPVGRAAQALVGPGVLLTVAILLAFQMHTAFSFTRSWPILLIVLGGLLLVRRLTALPSGSGHGAGTYPTSTERPS